MIVTSYTQNIQFTADGKAIPIGENTTATVQVSPTSAAWGTAVLTVKRGNSPTGPFYALETPTTIGNPGGMTVTIDVSGVGYLRVDVTTAEGGGSDEFVIITVCAKGAT